MTPPSTAARMASSTSSRESIVASTLMPARRSLGRKGGDGLGGQGDDSEGRQSDLEGQSDGQGGNADDAVGWSECPR